MALTFSWSTVFSLILAAFMFLSGIRDFQGKDPLINLPFNQYNRDTEYRAYWQKKNGVLFMFSGVMDLLIAIIPYTPLGSTFAIRLMDVVIVVAVIYFIVYEIWEHSND